MRPIELVIEGFRSYDRRTVFDWRDRQLIGIVGPIGSGKSSILDAITFALYGKTPVFERENKTLIREGRDSARVELLFRVEGQSWRALRVIRRRGPGQHALYRIEDQDRQLEGDREKQVTERITALLGLDFQAFCRSVLLAQNRFAEFLHASPGDRDKVLKGVFGFDRLDTMQRLAKERRHEYELEGRELRGRLSHIETDREQLDACRRHRDQALAQSQILETVAADIAQLEESARQAEHAAKESEERQRTLERVAEQMPDEAELDAFSEHLEVAAREQQEAENRWRAAQQHVEQAETALAATIAETGSGEALAAAEQTLLHLEQTVARRDRLEQARAEARPNVEACLAEVERARTRFREAENKACTQAEAVAKAESEREAARARLETHRASHGDRERLEKARQQLEILAKARLDLERGEFEVRQAAQRRLAAEDALEIVRLGWQAAEGDEQEASQLAKQQRERAARTEEAFHFARREDMATHLAHQLELNRPCPVCDQLVKELPAFRLTAAMEEAEEHRAQAQRRREVSEQALLEASKTAAGRRQALEHAEERLDEARRAEEEAKANSEVQTRQVQNNTAALRELIDLEVEALDTESLENQLRDFGARTAQLESQFATAVEGLRAAAASTHEARHEVEIARQQQITAEQSLAAARQTLERAETAWREAADAVKQGGTGIAIQLDGEHPKQQLADARERLDHATQTLETARAAERIEAGEVETARQLSENVRADQEGVLRQLAGLAGQLGLGLDDPSASLTPRELGQWLRQEEKAQRLRLKTELERTEEVIDEARQRRDSLWTELHLSPDVSFERALAEARSAGQQATQRLEELEERLRQAEEATQRLENVEKKIQLFQRLSEDLTPSRFLRYLLDEERRDLAALGSERFEMLSGGRYRFSDDGTFAVLDLANAEAMRKSETLSGGESFLASLALALALAEKVTGRGGRLDAFFLDEGFGSLDPEHFDLAMDGIERLVTDSPERLITVVSHVPEMRQRIEDLIILDKDPQDGSTIIREGAGPAGADAPVKKGTV